MFFASLPTTITIRFGSYVPYCKFDATKFYFCNKERFGRKTVWGVGEGKRGKDLLVRAKVPAVSKKVGSYRKLITTAVGTGNFLRTNQSFKFHFTVILCYMNTVVLKTWKSFQLKSGGIIIKKTTWKELSYLYILKLDFESYKSQWYHQERTTIKFHKRNNFSFEN